MTVRVALLVWARPGPLRAPRAHLYARAALELARDGIEVVFATAARGGRVDGMIARESDWEPVREAGVVAAYDRVGPLRRDWFARLAVGLDAVPIANAPAITTLCNDKLQAQRLLDEIEVPVPPVEIEPHRFEARVREWGAAYSKPRDGSGGRGIRRWTGRPAIPRAHLLQRAVEPPLGWRSVCVRVLAQREPDGSWYLAPPVARASRTSWVASNRTAGVMCAAQIHGEPELQGCAEITRRICAALAPRGLIEIGVDFAIDRASRPWVLEINAQPRGRLEQLAAADPARFGAEHAAVCTRPLRYLAARYG